MTGTQIGWQQPQNIVGGKRFGRMSSGIKQRAFWWENRFVYQTAEMPKHILTSRWKPAGRGKQQHCQVDLALRQWFIRCRRLLLVVVITIFKEMQQIEVSRYERAVRWQPVQTGTSAFHSLDGAEKCKINTSHFRFTLFSAFSRAQTSSEFWFTDLSRMQKQKPNLKGCSRAQVQRASRDSEIHGSNSGFQARKRSLPRHTSAKTFPSSLCV